MKSAVVTVSDRSFSGEREDRSGPALRQALRDFGADVVELVVVPDERPRIEQALCRLADAAAVDLVLTTAVIIQMKEFYRRQDIVETALAIRKVATYYAARKQGKKKPRGGK